MSIIQNIAHYKQILPKHIHLVAVSKTKPLADIEQAYNAGQRIFGENKVQEMAAKYEALPKDIEWHMIGHVQTNKVKYMAPFVSLVHGVDSAKLLREINKQGIKNRRVINCLLQVHIAEESSKFGFDNEELLALINEPSFSDLTHIKILGLMGMATFTDNEKQIRKEFNDLNSLFLSLKSLPKKENIDLNVLSMGMSGDFKIAIDCGSTMVRIGSSIFGTRNK
jgi:hypothetical protein